MPIPSLLFVDDDQELTVMLIELAQRQGWRAASAATGQAADTAIAAEVPQLVVLDMLLPDVHGAQLCRRWRQQYPAMSILVLSASEPPWHDGSFDHGGADGWLAKPVTRQRLVTQCLQLLRAAGNSDVDF